MVKPIKVVIAEDEWLAREELIYLLRQEADLELLPIAVNGTELLTRVDTFKPHVVFLDIQMPRMEGIEAARILKSTAASPLIIFTTAHEGYAVEAFGLSAVDYLLKPYSHERLKESLQRVRQMLTTVSPAQTKKAVAALPGKWNKLLMEDGEKHVLVDSETILYAVKEEKQVHIHTMTGQCFITRFTLQELEEKLDSVPLFRPHRSYLVNLNWIDELVPWFNGAYNLILKDGKRTSIPVSREVARELFRALKGE